MPAKQEIKDESKKSRSYLAFVSIFKGRRKSTAERNIIRLIHKSNIFKSNPILKTLLIENVRVTCIVVESSGKQSVKILCASAPYILTLISKANPNFENFLKSEKVSSCLKLFNERDFEYVLNNVYHTTVILYNGVSKLYTTIYVSFIKDSIPESEKLLLYLVKLILNALKSGAEFLSDNITFLFHYLRQKNYKLFTYVIDNFSNLIDKFITYSFVATEKTHKSVFLCARYLKNFVQSLLKILNNYSESALFYWLKKLYLFLKLSVSHLKATGTYNYFEQTCLHLFYILKPYLWKYCIELYEAFRRLIQIAVPYLKDTLHIILKESIPFLRKCINDNWETILNVCNVIRSFLFENIHYIKPFCCRTCRILYDSIRYVYDILQTVLPHVIACTSNVVIFSMTSSKYILDQCAYFCKILCCYIITVIRSQRHNFCRLSKNAISILKRIHEVILKFLPYIVLFSRSVFNELSKVIHVLSPTVVTCVHEMNSSVFYASKEVVGKSYLAVKRVTPSFYYSIKNVMPPTLLAMYEVLKSSTNCVVIISPAVLKFALSIRPEIKEGFLILFSDGNKAWIEIITVSYSASCQIKNAAITVSSNIPILYKAMHEILTTAAYATAEVTDKSLNAKSRMLKDVKRAHQVVQTSFVLAEQEVVMVYHDFVCEVGTFFPKSEECKINRRTVPLSKYFVEFFCCFSRSLVKIFKMSSNHLSGLAQNSTICIRNFSKLFLNVMFYVFFLIYSVSIDMIKPGVTKIYIMERNCFTSVFNFFEKNGYMLCNLCNHTLHCTSSSNIKIIQCVLACTPEVWHAFKSNVNAMWNKICLLAPELWTLIEYLASVFWNFIVEYTPGAWKSWKRFCLALWKLIHDLTPHVWQYSSTTVSVLWPSGRALTKQLWYLFTSTSSCMWQQTISFSSEYWLLSKTYLPGLWFTGCKETKTGWTATCNLIENCWNITVKSCSLSWNCLQCTVAKSWRNGVVFTKTAYCLFITTGSVFQKSFCVCSKTKKYVSVILKSTPLAGDFSLNSFRIPKLQRISQLYGK